MTDPSTPRRRYRPTNEQRRAVSRKMRKACIANNATTPDLMLVVCYGRIARLEMEVAELREQLEKEALDE